MSRCKKYKRKMCRQRGEKTARKQAKCDSLRGIFTSGEGEGRMQQLAIDQMAYHLQNGVVDPQGEKRWGSESGSDRCFVSNKYVEN